MTVSVTKCDICGKLKGEANKWLKGALDHDGRGLYICATHIGEDPQGLDICSDACLHKQLGEVLAAIRAEPEQKDASLPDGGIAVVCKIEEGNA